MVCNSDSDCKTYRCAIASEICTFSSKVLLRCIGRKADRLTKRTSTYTHIQKPFVWFVCTAKAILCIFHLASESEIISNSVSMVSFCKCLLLILNGVIYKYLLFSSYKHSVSWYYSMILIRDIPGALSMFGVLFFSLFLNNKLTHTHNRYLTIKMNRWMITKPFI